MYKHQSYVEIMSIHRDLQLGDIGPGVSFPKDLQLIIYMYTFILCQCVFIWACYMRADLKLQWRIAIAIFELPSVHTGEKTSPSLRFSIPERGQEAWFVFWHAEWCFILDRIAIRKCTVYWRKWLEGHVAPPPKSQFSGQGIHTVISLHYLRMRH